MKLHFIKKTPFTRNLEILQLSNLDINMVGICEILSKIKITTGNETLLETDVLLLADDCKFQM